jgi:DNA-binding response OmpR family regulator
VKILLVDDNLDILNMMSKVLAHRGHSVATCSTPFGVSALIVRDQPDVVVLDVMMPGLTGTSLATLIAKLEITAPPTVILWSAMEEEMLRSAAVETGLPSISKTLRPSEIAAEIERLTASRR